MAYPIFASRTRPETALPCGDDGADGPCGDLDLQPNYHPDVLSTVAATLNEEPIMKMFLAALALGAMIVSPAVAASDVTQKKVQVTKKAKPASPVRIQTPRAFSPYAHHPSYDVYVNGEYAGSDPDPRVRWSIRREWCQDALDGC